MAKRPGGSANTKMTLNRMGTKKRTSIGSGNLSRPKNKHTRANHKLYRGQGKSR